MKIYNTLNKRVEEFIPNEEGKVKLYTCGPTVYHYAHIGNLRTYIFEDILEKGLTYIGYDVKRCMNITDVGHLTSDGDSGDDKMQKGALREGKTVYEIAEYYTNAFFSDMDKLNIKRPEIIEAASSNIDVYINMVEKLIEDGFAYFSSGNVYFDISKYPDYYQLSGKNAEDLMVGVRDDVELDTFKKNPADFVLWFTVSKFSNQDMQWDSPWGRGYPGWHIECSGIAYKYLGEKIDIHCGGVDNIFPHHTNEIAQSECFIGDKWCNYWCHGSHLNDKSGKMSKSKGDFLKLDLLISKGYNPLVYRFFCLGSHYRNNLVFTYDSLDIANNSYVKLLKKIRLLDKGGVIEKDKVDFYKNKFSEAISNDLNTSSMLTLLYDVLKDDSINGCTKEVIISSFDEVLSLNLLVEEEITIDKDLEEMISLKILDRNNAKANKDFQLADTIRDELLEKGIKLIDSREGTTYEIL